MTFILLSTLALLSFSGAATASSLRLAINPRTLYSFKNNYADSSCTQLVSATMDVFYASTSATVIGSCSPETTGSGQTVFYKEILSEVNQYESCATGIVFSLFDLADATCSKLVKGTYYQPNVCNRKSEKATYLGGNTTFSISAYAGGTCGQSGASATAVPYLLYAGCRAFGDGSSNYKASLTASSLSCAPSIAPTGKPSTATPTAPTAVPTATPTAPTAVPTATPTAPTAVPTATPSGPTYAPTATPSGPTYAPTATPSGPTSAPSKKKGCFAGSETVTLESGDMIAISDIKIGDIVLTANAAGKTLFSEVVFVPHGANQESAMFTHISTIGGHDVKMTSKHILPSGVCGTSLPLVYASKVSVGDCIQTVSGQVEVSKVETVLGLGLYTIVTNEEFIVVNGIIASPFEINHMMANLYYNVHRLTNLFAPVLLSSSWLHQTNEALGMLSALFGKSA